MKRDYPNYRVVGLSTIKLKTKDKEILDKFLRMVRGSACERRTNNIKRLMLHAYDITEVSFDEWDIDTLRDFFLVLNRSKKTNSAKNDMKKTIKRFLREHYPDWDKRFKGFKDHSVKQEKELNVDKINKTTLIKAEELDLLLRGAKPIYQTYISCAYETAGRPSELLTTKFKDWDLKNKSVKLKSTKNNTIRDLPIKECIYYLKQFKQNYPFPNINENDFVFVSPENRTKHITLSAIQNNFARLTEKKLKRKASPYILRHTRLNFLIKKLSPKVYEKFADHSYEMGINTYSHIDDQDLKEEMYDKVFKRETLTKKDKEEITKLKDTINKMKEEQFKVAKGMVDLANQIREIKNNKTFKR